MKSAWFGIFIFILGIAFFWKREVRNVSGASSVSLATDTNSQIPTPVGIPSGPPSPSPSRPPVPDDIIPRLEKIQELARYALPTQDTRDALILYLSDPDLQSAVARVLTASDTQAYDMSQEKLRMNAVSVVGLMLRYQDVNHRDDVVRWVKQRILTLDFHSIKDLQVKQSVYGDITELLMILKQYEPESFEDVSRRIAETKNKVLKTALAASR